MVGLESAILEIHRFFKTTFTQQSEKKAVTMLQVMYTWQILSDWQLTLEAGTVSPMQMTKIKLYC